MGLVYCINIFLGAIKSMTMMWVQLLIRVILNIMFTRFGENDSASSIYSVFKIGIKWITE